MQTVEDKGGEVAYLWLASVTGWEEEHTLIPAYMWTTHDSYAQHTWNMYSKSLSLVMDKIIFFPCESLYY